MHMCCGKLFNTAVFVLYSDVRPPAGWLQVWHNLRWRHDVSPVSSGRGWCSSSRQSRYGDGTRYGDGARYGDDATSVSCRWRWFTGSRITSCTSCRAAAIVSVALPVASVGGIDTFSFTKIPASADATATSCCQQQLHHHGNDWHWQRYVLGLASISVWSRSDRRDYSAITCDQRYQWSRSISTASLAASVPTTADWCSSCKLCWPPAKDATA